MNISKDLLLKMELKNMKVSEVSLVGKGANKKVFYLIKNEEKIMDLIIKVLEKFGISGVTEDVLTKMQKENKGNFDLLKEYVDNFGAYADAMTSDAKGTMKKTLSGLIETKKKEAPAGDKGDTSEVIAKLVETMGILVTEMEKIKTALKTEGEEEEENPKEKTEMEKSLIELNKRLAKIEKLSGGKSSFEDGHEEIVKGGPDHFPKATASFLGA